MFQLELDCQGTRRNQVLCLGSHADDIEIGCGGTILRLAEAHPHLEFVWVVFSADRVRRREAIASAKRFLKGIRKRAIIVKSFRESFFPYAGQPIKRFFEQLKRTSQPHLILTHYRHDLHQDHRMISDLTWNTFRNHLILEYEIPKYDGDLGVPNFFVDLHPRHCERKVEILLECFQTQRSKQWFTGDTFRSLMRIRGIESNASSKFAEAFHCRKMVF